MKPIHELENTGIGKKALLIGNGNSVKGFRFNKLNLNEFTIFGINKVKQPIKIDYLIYYDKDIQQYYDNNEKEYDFKLIGLGLNKSIRCDYLYPVGYFIFADSGHHLLQLASNKMKFDEIYLIGYDYHTTSSKLRYHDERDYTQEEYDNYNKAIFNRALHKYTFPYCKHSRLAECDCAHINIWECNKIYNLNANSSLGLFENKKI